MEEKKQIQVGGQAVIEGVMMRGPSHIATAVRRKDGTIEVKKEKFVSLIQKKKYLNIPIIRGFISLIEMMIIGYKSLKFSADRYQLDLEEENTKKKSEGREKFEEFISYVFAFGLAFLLFAYLPYQIGYWIGLGKKNLYFNLFTGSTRIVFFVAYIKIISLMKDVHRLFEYHGAEHKSVFAYENNAVLKPAYVQKFSTLHPRCGTSFIFFVLLVSILIFAITDTIVGIVWGMPSIWLRISYHFLLLPIVSGVSYEILKLSGKNINHPLVKLMTAPGLALQRITTQPPDDEQIEVALVAMKTALELDISDYENVKIL
jgi:uncharacterized protein YqhQ